MACLLVQPLGAGFRFSLTRPTQHFVGNAAPAALLSRYSQAVSPVSSSSELLERVRGVSVLSVRGRGISSKSSHVSTVRWRKYVRYISNSFRMLIFFVYVLYSFRGRMGQKYLSETCTAFFFLVFTPMCGGGGIVNRRPSSIFLSTPLSRRRCRRRSPDEVLLQGAAQGSGRSGHLQQLGLPLPQGLGARKADRVRGKAPAAIPSRRGLAASISSVCPSGEGGPFSLSSFLRRYAAGEFFFFRQAALAWWAGQHSAIDVTAASGAATYPFPPMVMQRKSLPPRGLRKA